MADPNIDWVPVSALLDAAAKELGVGQLLHTSVFNLFEAMSAVEVGNSKMDAGCRPQGDPTPLEQRDLKLDLSQQQLIGVMDHLMSCEATWHNGGAVAKTVYSSMYMMQPKRTAQNVVLSAYCRALQALCAEVNHLIMNGCVCEEEDFNAHIAGLPLEHVSTAAGAAAAGTNPGPSSSSSSSSSNHTDKVLAAISHAIDSQDLPLKQSQAAPDSQAAAAAASLAAAIVARLQFRKLILSGMIRLKRRSKPDLDQAAKLFVRAQAELAVVRTSLGSGSDQGLGWDEDINSHLVPAVPPRVVQMYTPEKAVDYFESLLVQLLKVCHVTHVTGYQGLTDYLISFTAEPQCPIVRSAMHMLVGYTAWTPQQQQQQQQDPAAAAATGSSSSSSTYDQKHHQQHISPPDPHPAAAAAGSSDHVNGIAAAAAAIPGWALSPRMLCNALHLDPNGALGDDGALFIEQALIASGNTIQALLMNRSRCRRRLRRGLEDWGNLYQHALNADNSVQFQAYMTVHGWKWENEHQQDPAGPLATWVEAETCSVMVQHLYMGFELSLYEPADYQMIYWYIDLLCMVWQTNLSLLDKQQPAWIVAPAAAAAAKSSSSSSSSKATNGLAGGKLPAKGSSKHNSSSKGAAAAAAAAQKQPKRSPDVMLQGLVLELWRQLCMGTLRLMMALEMLGMYVPPEHPFNSEAQRYDQRFASFHLLTRPDPLAYDQFKRSTSTEGVDVVQLLELACGSFKQAIQAAAAIKSQPAAASSGKQVMNDLPKLERIAATNRVAAMLLARTQPRAAADGQQKAAAADGQQKAAATPQFKPHLEFGLQKWFPTVTLKSAAAAAAAPTNPPAAAVVAAAAAASGPQQ